jgi:transposase
MTTYIGCDAHKRYSVFAFMSNNGQVGHSIRVDHDRMLFRNFLSTLPSGSPIAVENIGSWYWIVDEMEKAGHHPVLAHAGKAKMMMGQINKTDKLDAKGLALLLRNGILPKVWIPPGGLRDQRELPRLRTSLARIRTILKNRIHATLAKYAIQIHEKSDIFGVSGREILTKRLVELPSQTRLSVEAELMLLSQVEDQISLCERQIREVVATTSSMRLLMTLPGVGPILAVGIAMEIGDIERFSGPDKLASYAGTVPRIASSGGKTFYGKVRPDANRYLKWAFVEAANAVILHQKTYAYRHVVQLYIRIKERKGHAKAAVAMARHLAEAAFWVLKKNEPYKEPKSKTTISSTRKETRHPHET